MKNKNINSGISFSLVNETAARTSVAVDNAINTASRIFIVLLLTIGSVFTFTSMMSVKFSQLPVYILIGVICVLLVLFYSYFKKHYAVMLIALGVAALAAVAGISLVITGGKCIYDSSIEAVYKAMNWTAPDPIIKWMDAYTLDTTYVIAFLAVVVANFCAYFTCARTNILDVFLCTFPLFEIGATFGCVPENITFALMLAGWVAAFVLHIANRQQTVIKHKNGKKVKKEKQFTYKTKSGKFGGSAIVMAVAVLLIFAISSNVLSLSGFFENERTNSLRKTVKEEVLNAYDLVTGYDHDASLKDGKLYNYADRKVKNRHYMTLSVPNTKEPLYLSGYIGSVYTGYSWNQLDESAYKELKDVKKHLKENGCSLPTITGDMLLTYSFNDSLKSGVFAIKDFRREKEYMYNAFGTEYNETIYPVQDKCSTATKKDNYSYTAFYQFKDIAKVPYTTLYNTASFIKQWNTYTEFVQKYYTLLPSGIDDVTRLAQQFSGDTIYALVDSVRDFLSQNVVYSDSVQKLPDDKEFTSFTIYNEQRGYSAHFASAMAVMLRALGVPTRYVEGVLIDKDAIKNAVTSNDGTKQVDITDGNYHAWIEVFDKEYGWVRIECTPGFYSGSMESFMNKARNEANKEVQEGVQNAPDNNKKPNGSTNNQQQPDDKDAPSAITSDNQDSGGALEKEDDKTTSKFSFKWYYVLKALGILLVIALAFLIIKRQRTLKKRERIFNSSNYKEQVLLAFVLIQKMLRFINVNISQTYSYDKYKQALKANSSADEATLDKIFEIYEMAQFSKILIDLNKAQPVLDFLDEFGYSLYSKQKFYKKFVLKFIYNLM